MPDPRVLTKRQRDIYRFIVTTVEQCGYQPTIQEMGEHFGVASKNGIVCHLRALEAKGFIRIPGQSGSIKTRAVELVGLRFHCVPEGATVFGQAEGHAAELLEIIHCS